VAVGSNLCDVTAGWCSGGRWGGSSGRRPWSLQLQPVSRTEEAVGRAVSASASGKASTGTDKERRKTTQVSAEKCQCMYCSLFSVLHYLRLRTWLRRYATSQKVAGSRPDEVIEFFRFT
jgi:hypothetical protein